MTAPPRPPEGAADSASAWLVLGRIGAPVGLKGALRVQSFTDPPERLLDFPVWFLRERAGAAPVRLARRASARRGSGLCIEFEGLEDRSAAERWCGSEVLIERSALPAPRSGEHFRDDLVGFAVTTVDGTALGEVQHFLDAPAGPLMVVRGERERWLPASAPHLVRIDTLARRITVDWPEDI